jgi:hypothetical protein
LSVYKVQGITKEEFVANAIHVEMQCRHLYISNAAVAYQAKHNIVDNDMD